MNFAGMIAANVLHGDSTVAHCDALPQDAFLLDVREPVEYDLGHLDGATLIPLGTLRDRLDELPKDKQIMFIRESDTYADCRFIDYYKVYCPHSKQWYGRCWTLERARKVASELLNKTGLYEYLNPCSQV